MGGSETHVTLVEWSKGLRHCLGTVPLAHTPKPTWTTAGLRVVEHAQGKKQHLPQVLGTTCHLGWGGIPVSEARRDHPVLLRATGAGTD